MHSIDIQQLEELITGMKSGRIRPEHIKEFLKNPETVLFRNRWTQKLIGLVPKDAMPIFFRLVDGKPFYCARRGDGRWQLFFGDWRSDLLEREPLGYGVADGKVYYPLQVGDSYTLFHGDSKTILPGSITSLHYQNGKFWFMAQRGGVPYLVNGKKETKLRVSCFGQATMSDDGHFCYLAKEKHELILIQGDKAVPLPYKQIWCLMIVNGKPAYIARDEAKGDRVVWGKKEYPFFNRIDVVNGLDFEDDQPFYLAANDKRHRLVVHGDKILLNIEDRSISKVKLIGGKPAYLSYTVDETASSEPFANVCVYGDHQTNVYNSTFSLHAEGNEIVFGARHGRELYRVCRPLD